MDFQEYPKCLYGKDGSTVTVQTQQQEDEAVEQGFKTAADHYGYDRPSEDKPDEKKPGKKGKKTDDAEV